MSGVVFNPDHVLEEVKVRATSFPVLFAALTVIEYSFELEVADTALTVKTVAFPANVNFSPTCGADVIPLTITLVELLVVPLVKGEPCGW
tara:strand:+ start:2307 stop:2576 length:270 start_codon:yes stop_codon:yes gene_type:complete